MPEFLTCYDYGTGGVWLYLEAASPAKIKAAYPELTVYETLPAWWNEENETLTRAQNFRDPVWQNWLSKLDK